MSYHKSFRPSKNRGQARGRKNTHFSSAKRSKSGRREVYIDPSKFVNRASGAAVDAVYEAKHKFSDFPLDGKLQENIVCKGYKEPSAIQDQAIPIVLKGGDVVGLANTGTGKTAAFLLPTINKMYADKEAFSAVILAPTRELAQQIDEQFGVLAGGMGLCSVLLVGGTNIDRQMTKLKQMPHLVIATPGRIMDLVKRKKVPLKGVRTLVLDEADRMLDMGFIGDVRKIVQEMPVVRQTLFFSATMTPKIRQLTEEFLVRPETISVVTASTSERVDQDIVEVSSKEEKMEKLLGLLGDKAFEKVLVFGRTKHGVQRLAGQLMKQGISAVAIHGNKSQSQRQTALRAFAGGKARVMVATDVAARGLDIPNVSHVINFDQPAAYEDYVHRIGRTGRGSATGVALTFVERK